MHVILDVAPLFRIAVLQPEYARRHVRRIMLAYFIGDHFTATQNFFPDEIDFVSDPTLRQCIGCRNTGIAFDLNNAAAVSVYIACAQSAWISSR